MQAVQSLRHVPWTCRWGRFGGPIEDQRPHMRGFVFWVCAHPEEKTRKLLDRGACEECPKWEPADVMRDS